jgi:hypothetical protein
MLLSVERPFVGASAFHIPGATLLHLIGLVKQSCRRRLNMANGHLGFSRNLGDPVVSSAKIPAGVPGDQLQVSAVHSSAGEQKERVNAEVPPNEGNEVRRDGR